MRKIKHYLKTAKGMPIKILAGIISKRIFEKLRDELNSRKALKKGTGITDKNFLRKLGIKDKNFFKEYENKQENISRILDTDFLEAIFNKCDAEGIINSLGQEEKQNIILRADKIINHEFNLLGSGVCRVSYDFEAAGFNGNKYNNRITSINKEKIRLKIVEKAVKLAGGSDSGHQEYLEFLDNYMPIDWHIDFKSGYRWDEKTWYSKINYGKNAGVDIKVPWELSRLQHLITLGQAYIISGDDKYAYEYITQVTDWIESNPPQFGANWKCTMDVGIRAANLTVSLSYFNDSEIVKGEFIFYLAKNIYLHGCHIFSNLEYGSITSNHYLSDITGLFFIGALFAKSRQGEKWQKFCIKEFLLEMKKQVYPDGTDFEASSCYHRLVLELFFYPVLFLSKRMSGLFSPEDIENSKTGAKNFHTGSLKETAGEIFGNDFMASLFRMFEFLLYLRKPRGRWPQIGDNDSGRLFIFSKRDVLDFNYLLECGAIFFKEKSFNTGALETYGEAVWLFGNTGEIKKSGGIDSKKKDKTKRNSRDGSRAFKDSGIYIMNNNNNYLAILCGPNGQMENGGHCHNDKLSFELNCQGNEIIVDPGTYIYTPSPESRNLFRSTGFHSTLKVDGQEQNRFIEGNLFTLGNESRAEVYEWLSTGSYDYFAGRHYGYNRFENPVTHCREIFFSKNPAYWLIRDTIEGCGDHLLEFNFHFLNRFELIEELNSAKLNLGEDRYFWIIPVRDDFSIGNPIIDNSGSDRPGRSDFNSNNPETGNLSPESIKVSRINGSFSKEYGVKQDSHILRFTINEIIPFSILFIMMSVNNNDYNNKNIGSLTAEYIDSYKKAIKTIKEEAIKNI